ncbi:MAG: dehydrogenase, partial [Verrucomicrobiota bacterium]
NFNDSWSQIINLQSGPDGAVYMIDWYDKNQCHHTDANGHDRSNGRIFKVSYGETKFEKVDLQKLSDGELVKLLASKNNWQARHAQRILQERSIEGGRLTGGDRLISDQQTANYIASKLVELLNTTPGKVVRLRALWTLHVVDDAFTPLKPFLNDVDEFVRAWTIQLLCQEISEQEIDRWPKTLDQLKRLAREDKSPVVRLYLASAVQRLPLENRWEIVEALWSHAEDANDPNLPLMYWYAAEPIIAQDTTKALALLKKTKIPLLRQFLSRRVTALSAVE